ncbi:2-polyprenyl-6-methoxyphenol hydroxylase [Micromonospora pattaloongensis]|uniref:2-polyprenyl-6-methoxyphenol hydroxylase n=1 Tax=Micromonospora pattaloongensis TaxID=405436 RepID=A0A1H3FTG2_9ACTN|nr:FAD-dependent monooxygenase [Micromonospora pattaloongensis]SDX94097.1 2-polyprenyl-6-methoxyphenol hydroxylase [Micromonospora pattaloongensis]
MVGSTVRILVVGAGIAGLAVTRALRLKGFRPEVVEKLPASTVPGAGIFLPGNAARALRDLGLDAPLRPLGDVIGTQCFLDVRGRQLCAVDLTRLWDGVGESRALPRADLHRVLLTGAGGDVRYDTEVSGVELGEQTSKVAFADGSHTEYDLVIGADGRRSAVRALAALGGAARPVGQLVYRSVVTGGPEVTAWTAVLGRRAAFVVMPMGNGRLYCWAEEPLPPDGALPADPAARLREVFATFRGPVPEVLDAVETVQLAATDEVELGRWSRGSVVLVGDAAHATAPTLSQGAAMAVEDALVLADALRRAESVPEALTAYERRRRPRTTWVLNRTRDRDRTRDVPPALRDPLLRGSGGRIFRNHYRLLVGPV